MANFQKEGWGKRATMHPQSEVYGDREHKGEHNWLNYDISLSQGIEPSHHRFQSYPCVLQETLLAWRQGQLPGKGEFGPQSVRVEAYARFQLCQLCRQ